MLRVIFSVSLIAVLALSSFGQAVDYPIIYLRSPHPEDDYFATIDVEGGYEVPTGELVLRHPDGSERVLDSGMITDPSVSIDGQSVYYSKAELVTKHGSDYEKLKCDIYRQELSTGEIVQLTDAESEWSPPRGVGPWAPRPAAGNPRDWRADYLYGTIYVWNTSPVEVGDGRVVFTSNRSFWSPVGEKAFGVNNDDAPGFQLYAMDKDGGNVERIGHFNIAGVLHPSLMNSGQVLFSSAEQQGFRRLDGGNTAQLGGGWGIWRINPDGGNWNPAISAYTPVNRSWHFQSQTTDGSIIASSYYGGRTYGTLNRIPPYSPDIGSSYFGDPIASNNPPITNGWGRNGNARVHIRRSFQPYGMYSITPWTHDSDWQQISGVEEPPVNVGAVQHPSRTPNNGVLLTWTGQDGSSRGATPHDLGVYLIPDVSFEIQGDPHDLLPTDHLVKVVDQPDRHEWMAVAVVPREEPPFPRAKKSDDLPVGSPYGVVGTSSLAWRELDHTMQGGDFDTDEIEWVRILSMMPVAHTNKTSNHLDGSTFDNHNFPWRDTLRGGFSNQLAERVSSYETLIPVKKWKTTSAVGGEEIHYGPNPPDGAERILDERGEPDSSFAVELPANQSWSFQLLNDEKEALTTAQTWHQLTPGESRTDCRGCHAHNRPSPQRFEQTFASTEEYTRLRLDKAERVTEWHADVVPVLDSLDVVVDDPKQLLRDERIRLYDSRNSSFMDEIKDAGATAEQVAIVAKWIDTGITISEKNTWNWSGDDSDAPLIVPDMHAGAFADSMDPTLEVVPGRKPAEPVSKIVIGAADPNSGINRDSLSVVADFPVNGRNAGVELADLFIYEQSTERWLLDLDQPVNEGILSVSVRDNQAARGSDGAVVSEEGNITTVTRSFVAQDGGGSGGGGGGSDDCEELEQRVAELELQLGQVNEDLQQVQSDLTETQGDLQQATQENEELRSLIQSAIDTLNGAIQ